MTMSSMKWLLSACGAMLIGGLASTASANFKLDVVMVGNDGVPVAAADSKAALVTHVGQKFSFELWVTVQGATTAARDEDYASISGGLISYGGQPIGKGKFLPTGEDIQDPDTGDVIGHEWWTPNLGGALGSTGGAQNNIATLTTPLGTFVDDGSPDMGNTGPIGAAELGDWMSFNAKGKYTNRSPVPGGYVGIVTLPSPSQRVTITTPNPFGFKLKVASFDWVVTDLNSGQGETDINWLPRMDLGEGGVRISNAAAVYALDNVSLTPASPLNQYDNNGKPLTFDLGDPVRLTIVPEPASLSLLALGALGLLARRRK